MNNEMPVQESSQPDNRFPMSVATRLVIILLLTTVVIFLLAVTGLVLYDEMVAQNIAVQKQEVHEKTADREAAVNNWKVTANVIGAQIMVALQFDDPGTGKEILSTLAHDPHIVLAATYRPDGSLFAEYRRDKCEGKSEVSLPGMNSYRIEGTYVEVFQIVSDKGQVIGTIFLKSELENQDAPGSDYVDIVGLPWGVFVLLGMAVVACLLIIHSTWRLFRLNRKLVAFHR